MAHRTNRTMEDRRNHTLAGRLTRSRVMIVLTLMLALQGHASVDSPPCEVGQLRDPSAEVQSVFGGWVSIYENVAAICDVLAFSETGAVYIFRLDGVEWHQEALLKAPVPNPDDAFARVAAISGNVVAVSAHHADTPEFHSGAVHIYRFDAETSGWSYETTLTASDGDHADLFGSSVALDRNVALFGARNDDIDGVVQVGSAYVFRYDGKEWIEEAKLIDPEGETYDYFGRSAAVTGDVALVGAPGKNHGHSNDGSAFVFRHNGTAWVLEAELTTFDSTVANQRFGWSVSLTDDLAVVGAPYDDGHHGAVYVFRHDGQKWLDEARLSGSAPVGFSNLGGSVSVSPNANVILAGAPDDSQVGFESGAAYVFRNEAGVWNEVVKLTPTFPVAFTSFGGTVSVYRDKALIGAPGEDEDDDPGLAYTYAGMSGTDCNGNSLSDACDIVNEFSNDKNINGIPDECEAAGDLNGDGVVNVVDFLELLDAWGLCPEPCPPACTGDTNADCVVDVLDFLILLANWG